MRFCFSSLAAASRRRVLLLLLLLMTSWFALVARALLLLPLSSRTTTTFTSNRSFTMWSPRLLGPGPSRIAGHRKLLQHHTLLPSQSNSDDENVAQASSLSKPSSSVTNTRNRSGSARRARDLIESLVVESQCFTTVAGARAFGEACDLNVVYEDRFEPQPIVGRLDVTKHLLQRVAQRNKANGDARVRLDRMSDGDTACGFCWTWTCGREEGLRGTTFVQLNNQGMIQYVQEIPEPIYKPGDLTRELLMAITLGADPKIPQPFERKTPTVAHELARYLFVDLQKADDEEGRDEVMRFFDDNVVYRDFNFEDVLRGPEQVRKFLEDFTFPGIEFRPLRFDDGVDATCFTWEVVLDGAEDSIKGISYYQLDPISRKIVYVRDVPESAIKPPILGKLARDLRPGLGVFQGVPLGSRPNGM